MKRYLRVQQRTEADEVPSNDLSDGGDTEYYSAFSKEVLLLYAAAWFNVLSLAVSMVPLVIKINLTINGDANKVSSESVIVYATILFLQNFTQFISSKYNAAMSDYTGRKPILIVSAVAFCISRIIYGFALSPSHFYVGAVMSGTFNCFHNICLAWVCDLCAEQDRGKAFGLLTGIALGFGFMFGIPFGAIISSIFGPELPLCIAAFINFLNVFFVFCIRVDDTRGSIVKLTKLQRADTSRVDCDEDLNTIEISGEYIDHSDSSGELSADDLGLGDRVSKTSDSSIPFEGNVCYIVLY